MFGVMGQMAGGVRLSPLDLVLPSALNDGDTHGVLWVALDAACEEAGGDVRLDAAL